MSMRSIRRQLSSQLIVNSCITGLLIVLLSACSSSNQNGSEIRVPQNIVVNAGSREVELSWQGTPGASSYTVYWQVAQGVVEKSTAYKESVPKPYYLHTNLSNGVTYYYRITANTSSGESKLSDQVQATPKQRPPEKPILKQTSPDGFQAYPGDGEVTLAWAEAASAGAARYSILWRLSGSDNDYQRIDNAVSPFVQQGLINGRTYGFRLLGVNDEGESLPSEELLVTPQKNAPAVPKNLSATVQQGSATLSWDDVSNAEGFEIYWNTTGGVSLSDNHISGVRSPFTHAPLLSGQTYYYKVRALNQGGASALSGELSLTPPDNSSPVYTPLPAPALTAPQVTVTPNDSRLLLTWSAVPNATGYNLYWNTTGNVTPGDKSTVKIANIAVMQDEGSNQLQYVHAGLVNGQNYYYRLAAFNDGDGQDDEVLSVEVGPNRPEQLLPGAPANVRVIGGDGWAGVRWNPVQNATGYKLYWKEVGKQEYVVDPVESPYALYGLVNGTTYQMQVSAVDLSGAEKRSTVVNVTPQIDQPSAPQGVSVTPGDQQVLVQWDANPSEQAVTHYKVYYGFSPGVKPGDNTLVVDAGTDITNTQVLHSLPPLTNGRRYYYVVTAVNAGGESVPSQELWAIPNVATPGAPTLVNAKAKDKAVDISWQPPDNATGGQNLVYNLYWQSDSGNGRSNTVVIPSVTSPYSMTGLTNNVKYYFKVSAVNEGGEGVFSSEVTATPYLPPPALAPAIDSIVSGDGQVSLSWTDPNAQTQLTAESYTLYWSTSSQIDLVYGPRIDGLKQTNYVHQGLTNGLTYYYRVVAVNQGGQSPVSALDFAQPQVAPPAQAPANFIVLAGDKQASFQWQSVPSASNYTIYWSTDPNRPLEQWAAILGANSGAVQTNLQNGTRYYYYLRAVNAGGQGPLSNIVSAMPQEPPPAAPTGISAAADDGQVIINWTSKAGLTYHLYWSTSPGVSTTSQHFTDVHAAYVHAGLNNDAGPYYYRLQAENAGGFSPLSQEVSADPAPPVTGAPIGLSAQGGDGQVILSWLPPAGAGASTTYTLYWYTDPNNPANRTAIPNVSSPYVHTNRSNGTTYYYVVTATNESGESPTSAPAQARPMPAAVNAPATVQAVAGQSQVSVQWSAVGGADRYYVYWSADQTAFDPAKRFNVSAPTTQYTVFNLASDTTYYFYITAENLSGESGSSYQVSATTALAPNQLPTITQGTLVNRNIGIGGAVAINLNANDPDGDPLTWQITQSPTQGSATFNNTAGNDVILTYQHTAAVSSQDTFWVEVSDNRGGSDSVQIVVNASNQAPVWDAAVPSQVSIEENIPQTTVIMTLSATDGDGDTVTYALDGGLDAGLFSLDAQNGQLRFLSSPNYDMPSDSGADNHYQVSVLADDGKGELNSKVSKNLVVIVTNVNEPPSITSAPITTAIEAQTYTYALQVSDEDLLLNSDTMSYTLLSAPAGMSVNASGVISWTPDASAAANNPNLVEVQVSDIGGLSDSQSFSIQVTPVSPPTVINNPPVANNDSYTVAEGGSLTAPDSTIQPPIFGVLNNDTDQDGDTLTVTLLNGPVDASSFTLNPDGSFTYIHNGSETTSDSFTYQVDDNSGQSNATASATVSITITPVNDPPNITGQNPAAGNFNSPEDTDIPITLSNLLVSDPDNVYPTGFTLNVQPNPASSYSVANNLVTPALNYNGPLNVLVTVNDGTDNSKPYTLVINVTPQPDAPQVNNAIASQSPPAAQQGLNYTFQFATDTFIDPDGDPLTYTAQLPGGGSLPGWLSFDGATRTFSGTPANGDVNAAGFAIEVIADDNGHGGSAADTFTLVVKNTNDPPQPVADSATVIEDGADITIDVLANDTDPDGDTLILENVAGIPKPGPGSVKGTYGTLHWNADNSISYTLDNTLPAVNALGDGETLVEPDFGYVVGDGIATAASSISITVQGHNDAPTVSMDSPAANQSIALGGTVNFAATGTDPEDDTNGVPLTYQWNFDAASGVTPNPNTSEDPGAITFDTSGTFNVTLTVTDSANASTTVGPVTITVASNQAPNAVISQPINGTIFNVGDLVSLDPSGSNDPDNHLPLQYQWDVSGPANFSFSSTATAPSVNLPNSGAYTVTLVVTDSLGLPSSPASVQISVNTPPTGATLSSSSVAENSAANTVIGTLTAIDPDVGDTHTFTLANGGDAGGRFTIINGNELVVANGALLNYETATSHDIVVEVRDLGGTGAPVSQPLTINVTNVDEPPAITSAASASAEENLITVFTLTGSDPENAAVNFRITGGADSSAFYVVPGNLPNTAELRLIRAADFEAPADSGGDNTYNVQVTASDGVNDSAPQDLVVTVTNVVTENSILGIFADAKLQQCVYEYATLNDWKYTYQITGTMDCSQKGITDLSGMEQLSNLEGLNLQNNSVTDVTPLSGLTKLKELSLASNNISSLAAPNFTGIDTLDNVSILWLENNTIADFSPLTGMANLRDLIVWNNNITDLTTSNIASLTSLNRLWLQQNPISDVTALAAFTNLVNLGLSQLGLSITTPAQITGLGSLTTLQVLWLENDGLTSTSGLQSLVNLQELYLYGNQIRDVTDLAGITTLNTLYLGGNGLTSAGLVNGLSSLSGLTSLSLYGNAMTDISALSTSSYKSSLKTLYLGYNQLTDITALSGFTNLEYLDLDQNTNLVTITALAPLTKLSELFLELTSVSDLSPLNGRTTLKRFGTTFSLSVQDYSPIATFTNLEELYLNDAGYTDQSMSALTNLVHLKKLYLSGGNYSITDVSALANLKSLEILELGSNKIVNLAPLAGLQKLNYLSLNANQVVDVSPLNELYGLKSLYLSQNSIVGLSGLSGLVGLGQLYLSQNQIEDVSPLAALERLFNLDLSYNQINATGNGNVDSLISFISPRGINLLSNPAMDCTKAQTLVNAYPAGVVAADILDPTRYCTDYAALHSTATVSSSWTTPTAGATITITVLAYDKAGNPKTTGGDTVVVTPQYPFVNFTAPTPLQVTDNNDGTYTASYPTTASGQDNFMITINGAPIGPKDVADANGVLKGLLTIDILANQQPTAVISQPATGDIVTVNQQVLFDGSTSFDSDGNTPLTYSWTISNGTTTVTSNVVSPTFSFSQAGTYTAQLTVTDLIGLASPVASVSFTVAVPLAGLFSADANLQACVDALGFTYAYEVTSLSCGAKGITNLSGIENLTNLTSLTLGGNPNLIDLTPLANPALSGLGGLFLTNNTATDNASLNLALANLVNLWILRIDNTGISDISGLSNLTGLTTLDISNNPIADFSPLSSANLATLQSLTLTNTGFSDATLLSAMVNLVILIADTNQIVDVAPIGNLPLLANVNLRANLIGGLGVGHVDSLGGFNSPSTINLLDNPTASCSELNRLLYSYSSLGAQPVSPSTLTVGTNCTIDPTETLNDTGATQCTDTVNSLTCPVAGYPGQDGEFGRDPAAINDNANGLAGFVFTKLDALGNALPLTATSWSCVRDDVSGYVWEVKTADGSLHDAANSYSWYDADTLTNGGDTGDSTGASASCSGVASCNTKAMADALNTANFCGFSDWRVPSLFELNSIVDYGLQVPAVDTQFFPNINSTINYYWASETSSADPASAIANNLSTGATSTYLKTSAQALILVRGRQKK